MQKQGNALLAVLGSDSDEGWQRSREVDQVVVEHGTLPADELYFELRPQSRNLGEVDYAALIGTGPIFPERNGDGSFYVYRIGDAVSSRNIHAAVYDALRYGVRW